MDKTTEIILEIENAERISFEQSFKIVSYCTQLLSQHSAEAELSARKIVIHVLNNWGKIDKNLYVVWADLIETLGFYPYIQKNSSDLKIMSFADDVRMSYFKSDFLKNTYLHKEQKKISNYLLSGKNIIASAPTSFGKSLLIEEIVASKKYKNIVIIQPTLALLDETRLKLKKYADDYKIIVRTSQPYSEDKRNLFLLTAERVMEYEPLRARRMAKVYLEYLQRIEREKNNQLPLIEWINKNVSPEWSLAKELQYGVAIHDGSLQKHIGASIIKYFNEGRLNCIFCTSTIIEGVNTSAKNVILFDEKKGGNEIDFFDYSNIKGRSGRMMEHYVGRIFNFCHVPVQKSIVIDIPFYEQDPEILTNEILINIKKNDVKQEVRNRYDQINALPADLLSIIKQNGVSVNGQIRIYNKLISDLKSKSVLQNIQWSQLPTWDQMYYVLELAENNLFNFDSKRGVFSVKQLARYLNMYRTKKNIIDIVNDIYNSKIATVKTLTDERKARYYDEAVETAFHIYRHIKMQ